MTRPLLLAAALLAAAVPLCAQVAPAPAFPTDTLVLSLGEAVERAERQSDETRLAVAGLDASGRRSGFATVTAACKREDDACDQQGRWAVEHW